MKVVSGSTSLGMFIVCGNQLFLNPDFVQKKDVFLILYTMDLSFYFNFWVIIHKRGLVGITFFEYC